MAAPYVRQRVGELATSVRKHVDDIVNQLADLDALDRAELLRIAALIGTRAERVAETATAVPRPPRSGRRPLRRPSPHQE